MRPYHGFEKIPEAVWRNYALKISQDVDPPILAIAQIVVAVVLEHARQHQ